MTVKRACLQILTCLTTRSCVTLSLSGGVLLVLVLVLVLVLLVQCVMYVVMV